MTRVKEEEEEEEERVGVRRVLALQASREVTRWGQKHQLMGVRRAARMQARLRE